VEIRVHQAVIFRVKDIEDEYRCTNLGGTAGEESLSSLVIVGDEGLFV
jgi:hypothetical protein